MRTYSYLIDDIGLKLWNLNVHVYCSILHCHIDSNQKIQLIVTSWFFTADTIKNWVSFHIKFKLSLLHISGFKHSTWMQCMSVVDELLQCPSYLCTVIFGVCVWYFPNFKHLSIFDLIYLLCDKNLVVYEDRTTVICTSSCPFCICREALMNVIFPFL